MPKVEHLIQKDQNIRLIGWNTHLLQGTFLWKFTAVNYRVILIVTCIGSGIWKSFKVFCEMISLSASYSNHFSLQTFIAWRKTLLDFFSKAEDHQNNLLSWKLTFFIIVQTVLSRRCSTSKSLAFVLPLLLHNTGLSGLYTEATKCDDMGYKPFTPSLVISVASMILLRLNSLDLHWPRI